MKKVVISTVDGFEWEFSVDSFCSIPSLGEHVLLDGHSKHEGDDVRWRVDSVTHSPSTGFVFITVSDPE